MAKKGATARLQSNQKRLRTLGAVFATATVRVGKRGKIRRD